MKKLLGILFLFITTVIFIGCDNNKGPFQVKNENGEKILYSGKKPAKGWVENTIYDYYGESTKVYEIYFDDGLPAGDFRLYDLKGNLVVDAKGKWKNGLFEGKIEEPKENVIAKGKFAINLAYLINFNGKNYYNFSYDTLIDGNFESNYYKYSKKNGLFEGKYIFNGNSITRENKVECMYNNGILNGEYISYHLNGKIREKMVYKDNLKNGKYIHYRTDGTILEEGEYLNNQRNGKWSEYRGNEEKINIIYVDGKRVSTQILLYDSTGHIEREINYKDNDYETDHTLYYKSGKVKAKIAYVGGYGKYKEYYENGNIKEEGNYADDRKDGECIYYLESGKPYIKYIYDYGRIVSEVKI